MKGDLTKHLYAKNKNSLLAVEEAVLVFVKSVTLENIDLYLNLLHTTKYLQLYSPQMNKDHSR